jgi:hypothetical protein
MATSIKPHALNAAFSGRSQISFFKEKQLLEIAGERCGGSGGSRSGRVQVSSIPRVHCRHTAAPIALRARSP